MRKIKVNHVAILRPKDPAYQGNDRVLIDEVDGEVSTIEIGPEIDIEKDMGFIARYGIVMFEGVNQQYIQDVIKPMARDMNSEGLEAITKYGFKLKKPTGEHKK